MSKNVLAVVIEKLLKVLNKYNIKLVLMGGIATSVLASPRATFDIDGMIDIPEEEFKKILLQLRKKGFKLDAKQPIKEIQGLPFLSLYFSPSKTYVDLFIVKSDFQKKIMKRARKVHYDKISIKIISAEDLILVKLQSGRDKDIQDIREIIIENRDNLNYNYLREWAKTLGIEVFLEDELKSLK